MELVPLSYSPPIKEDLKSLYQKMLFKFLTISVQFEFLGMVEL